MLTLSDWGQLGRRNFLRIGSLGLGGMSLSNLIAAQSSAHPTQRPITDKSVIYLFMHGGPSQTETFDPKMTAPSSLHSQTGEVKTSIPGVTFGGTFPQLAQLANKLAVVRSFVTGDGKHDIKPVVSKHSFGANLGSMYSRVAGITSPETGLPSNVALFPRSVDPATQPANMNFGKFTSPGSLGSAYTPFDPSGGGNLQKDMELTLPMQRLDDRRGLLTRLDLARSVVDATLASAPSSFRQQAFSTILGGVADAFDLSKEDPKTLARYDTGPLVRPENIDRRWNNYNNYVDNAKSLGKLLLLARRLCERGCGFVTVTTNFVWDMHSDVNNAPVAEGMRYMGFPFDHAVSAFIRDLEARGLRDKILLVCSGEMGRTPRVNARGGRDHWGSIAPLLLYGGGLNMGQVIGQSTSDAGQPQSNPYTIRHLLATIFQTLFDVGELRVTRGVPKSVIEAGTEWEPISELV